MFIWEVFVYRGAGRRIPGEDQLPAPPAVWQSVHTGHDQVTNFSLAVHTGHDQVTLLVWQSVHTGW